MPSDQTKTISWALHQNDSRKCQFVSKISTISQCHLLLQEDLALQSPKKENISICGELEFLENFKLQIESRKYRRKLSKYKLALISEFVSLRTKFCILGAIIRKVNLDQENLQIMELQSQWKK